MKKGIIYILFLLFGTLPLYAQEETLISEGKITHGGYGGPEVKFTTINDNFGLLVGGRGGWIINHTIILGGGGYGLTNAVKAKVPSTTEGKYVDFGYGGFALEWIIKSDKLIHFSISSMVAGGGVRYRHDMGDNDGNHHAEACLVVEPGATAELNITKFFRLSLGASYRYVSGVSSAVASNSSLSGLSLNLLLRFGKF